MSSISAALGNRGQADYAAANGIMNGLAGALVRANVRAVAFNWGPWDQTGMVSDAVREQFQSRGVQLIPVDDGVRFVTQFLDGSIDAPALVVAGDGPWSDARAIPDSELFVAKAAANLS